MQGLRKWTIGKVQGAPDGAPPPYYYVADLYADSREAFEQMLASPEGQAAVADVPNYATGGAAYNAWLARVQNANLPGAAANPPDIAASQAGAAADPSTVMTVRVNWKAPNEAPAAPVHSVTVVAQIK